MSFHVEGEGWYDPVPLTRWDRAIIAIQRIWRRR